MLMDSFDRLNTSPDVPEASRDSPGTQDKEIRYFLKGFLKKKRCFWRPRPLRTGPALKFDAF